MSKGLQPCRTRSSSSWIVAAVQAVIERGQLGQRHLNEAAGRASVGVEQADRAAAHVHGAGEITAPSDRPGARRSVERERPLDLVEKIERVPALAVHLVDEGDDRDVAQPANLEQLAGARFDALGRVDHHDRRIDRGKRPIGVLREVLVAGSIEEVEHSAVMLEGHHRCDDGNAALALDRHPVRAGGAPVTLGLDLPRQHDGAAEQQQLLRQRGLAGIGMGDDGEGAAALDLGCKRRERRLPCGSANGHVHGAVDVAAAAAAIKVESVPWPPNPRGVRFAETRSLTRVGP